MKARTSVLSTLLVVVLVSTTQAVSVSYQNGDSNGYTGHASVGFNGNNEPLPSHAPYLNGWGGLGYIEGIPKVANDGFRNHVQLIRFDDIFGAGPNQIPEGEGVTIDSATLTVIQFQGVTYTFDLHRALLPWSNSVVGVALYDTDPGVRPRGPDLFINDDEVSSTVITSAPAIPRDTINDTGGEIVFDVTTDIQYFLDNPAERNFWVMARTAQASGTAYYSYPLVAGELASAGPLLEITFSFPPVPEPSTAFLLGIGALGLVAQSRRRKTNEAYKAQNTRSVSEVVQEEF